MADDRYVPVLRYEGSKVHVARAFHEVILSTPIGKRPLEEIGGSSGEPSTTRGLAIGPGGGEGKGHSGVVRSPVEVELRHLDAASISGSVIEGLAHPGEASVMFIADDYQLEHVVRELGHAIVDAQREVWLVTPEPK